MKLNLACLIAVLMPVFAFADSVADTITGPNCKKPLAPSVVRKADGDGDYDERVDAYRDCVKTYVDDQQAISQKHIDAANTAINDLNVYVKEVNDKRQQ